jgi:hypothetical protein
MNRHLKLTHLTLRIVIAAVAASAGVASFAQTTDAAQPAGKTRAEVVAETRAAYLRGELQAGHEWGIDVPPMTAERRAVLLAAKSARSQQSQQ